MINFDVYNNDYLKVVPSDNNQHEINSFIDIIDKSLVIAEYKGYGNKGFYIMPIEDINAIIKICRYHRLKFFVNENIFKRLEKIKKIKRKQRLIKKYMSDKRVGFDVYNELMKLKLHRFQQIGAEYLYRSKNCALADDVGLGKTLQALAAMERHYEKGNINFILIICPSSLRRNWVNEIKKFCYDPDVICIDNNAFTKKIGSSPSKTPSKSVRNQIYKRSWKYRFLVLHYDILQRDFVEIEQFILDKFKIGLIADEIHKISNPHAKRSVYLKKIANKCLFKIGLSATIIENNLFDVWSSFHAIRPACLGGVKTKEKFTSRFVEVDFFDRVSGYKNKKHMLNRISPWIIRRNKSSVLSELPKRTDTNLWIDLSIQQQRIYNDVQDKLVHEIKSQEKRKKIEMAKILAMLSYLRQAALHTALIEHEIEVSTKLDVLFEIMEDVGKSTKLVVFCFYRRAVDLIAQAITDAGITNIAVHGKNTKTNERTDIVKSFNDDNTRVLVTNDVLREGQNITGASVLVNFDLLYNPAALKQRAGRIDRIGQKSPNIHIISIIANNTIEETMFEIMANKARLFESFINKDVPIDNRLTIKNVKQLLRI